MNNIGEYFAFYLVIYSFFIFFYGAYYHFKYVYSKNNYKFLVRKIACINFFSIGLSLLIIVFLLYVIVPASILIPSKSTGFIYNMHKNNISKILEKYEINENEKIDSIGTILPKIMSFWENLKYIVNLKNHSEIVLKCFAPLLSGIFLIIVIGTIFTLIIPLLVYLKPKYFFLLSISIVMSFVVNALVYKILFPIFFPLEKSIFTSILLFLFLFMVSLFFSFLLGSNMGIKTCGKCGFDNLKEADYCCKCTCKFVVT